MEEQGRIRHLDTISFDPTIRAYERHVREFHRITNLVNRTLDNMRDNWKGLGHDAFLTCSRQIQDNLKDISGIMYDMRDALAHAYAQYLTADAELAKGLSME